MTTVLYSNGMFYRRKLLDRIERELTTREATVITGPRQVGKTTILKYLFDLTKSPNKAFFDFENPFDRLFFEENNFDNIWFNLAKKGLNKNDRAYIFIDEIQNLPSISQSVKYLIDHHQTKFFLTGSSGFYLKNLFPESMSGRKLIFELLPLSFPEFLQFKQVKRKDYVDAWPAKAKTKNQISFGLYRPHFAEYIQYGGYPSVVLENDFARKTDLLKEIFKSYFEKDIRILGDFQDLARLRNLIVLLTNRIGSKLDISKIDSELGASRVSIYRDLTFLEQTYLISLMPKFSRNVDRQSARIKKLFFFDSGLANYLGQNSVRALLENVVWQQFNQKSDQVNYFDNRGSEIDFIVDNQIGFEVKNKADRNDVRRLQQKCRTFGLPNNYVISLNWSSLPEVILAADL